MKPSKRILLVDDHALVRAGICSLIEQLNGFTVIAESANVAGALRQLQESPVDIVITDLDMGAENGLELVKKIGQYYPHIPVIVLSMHSSEEFVSEALRYGASAYLLKEAAPEELSIALGAISRGQTFLSPAVSTKMINRFVRPDNAPDDPLRSLTERQIQILTMLAKGKSAKGIAFELDLSDKTVAAHRSQIMERLGIKDLVGLVLFAVKHKLVDVSVD